MTSPPTLPLVAFCAIASSAAAAAEVAPSLEAELKEVYAGWSKAMVEQDRALWRKTTASYRQIGTRNIIVSQKKRWPDALFDTAVTPADVSGLKLAKVMAKGPTAQLVYYGKADFGVDEEVEIPDGLLFLMFVRERDGWRFNTSRFMSLADAGEVADRAAAGDFSFLEAPQFRPPGEVPPLPKPCPFPDVVGLIEIVSLGYEAKVDVDGRSQHVVIDNVQTGLIIGGLKAGINKISVEVRPLRAPPGEPGGGEVKRRFEFNIYRKPPRPAEPPKLIYESGPIAKPGKFSVIVRGAE